MQFVS